MKPRSLSLVIGGAAVVIVLLAVLQAPPLVWLFAGAIATLAIGSAVVAGIAAHDGNGLARSVLTRTVAPSTAKPSRASTAGSEDGNPALATRTATASRAAREHDVPAVDVEIVRPGEAGSGAPTVWLHRCGGRRVHRLASDDGWIVQQVSTKDPDNPKKRVIGRSLRFASEDEAVRAADHLAQGILPEDIEAAREYRVPPSATAEARRRKVRLTGMEQARRLAAEWGIIANA